MTSILPHLYLSILPLNTEQVGHSSLCPLTYLYLYLPAT